MKKEDLSTSKFSRETICETPHGGVRMVAYFYDENGEPCIESKAKQVQILEFDADDVCIFAITSMS